MSQTNAGVVPTSMPTLSLSYIGGQGWLAGPIRDFKGKLVDFTAWANLIVVFAPPNDPNVSSANYGITFPTSYTNVEPHPDGTVDAWLDPRDYTQIPPGAQGKIYLLGELNPGDPFALLASASYSFT